MSGGQTSGPVGAIRRGTARLLTAFVGLVVVVVCVPWLVEPLSAALVADCQPDGGPATPAAAPAVSPASPVEGPGTRTGPADASPTPALPPELDLFGGAGGDRAIADASPTPGPPPEVDPLSGGDRAIADGSPTPAPAPALDLFGGAAPPGAPPSAPEADDAVALRPPDDTPAAAATCPDGLPDDLPSASHLTMATLLSLLVGLIAALVATAVGGALGLLSGYRGGLAERLVVGGFANGLDALPQFVLLVTAAALYRDLAGTEDDTRLLVMGMLIGLVNSTQVLLVVHHQTRLLTTRKFVVAARLMGWTPARVIRHKVLPHLRHELLIPFTQLVVWGLFMETALSYIGFSPTSRWPTLGTELYRLEPFVEPADLGPTLVMCAITVLVALALRAMGDALEARSIARDALRFAPEDPS